MLQVRTAQVDFRKDGAREIRIVKMGMAQISEDQAQLGKSKYPVLVTTSRLLSTGVDVQTCRLVVLDREVGSMTKRWVGIPASGGGMR